MFDHTSIALEWTPELDPSAHDAVASLFDRFGAPAAASQLAHIGAGVALDLQLALGDTRFIAELYGAGDGTGIEEVESSAEGALERIGVYLLANAPEAEFQVAIRNQKAAARADSVGLGLSCT